MMAASRRLGAAHLLLGQWGKYALQVASLIVLARVLAPEDYGLMAMTTAFIGLAGVVGDFGLSLSAIRSRELLPAEKTRLFWANFGIGGATAIVVAAISPLIGSFYGQDELVGLTAALSIVFLINGLAAQFKVELNRRGRFGVISSADVVGQLAGFLVAVVAALNGAGVWALVMQSVIAAAVVAVIVIWSAEWLPSFAGGRADIRHHLRFGASTFFLQCVNYISSNIDTVAIGRFIGAGALGLYNRAFQLVSMPVQQLVAPLTRVTLPYLAEAVHSGDLVEFQRRAHRLHSALSIGLLPVLAFIAGASRPLLEVLLGPEWGAAWSVLQILALGAAFQTAGYVYYWIFLALAKTKALLLSELPGRLLMIIAVPLVAINGSTDAIAGVVAGGLAIIWLTASLIVLPRNGVRTTPFARALVAPAIAAVVAYSATRLSYLFLPALPSVVELLIACAAWLASVATCVAVLPSMRRQIAAALQLLTTMRR